MLIFRVLQLLNSNWVHLNEIKNPLSVTCMEKNESFSSTVAEEGVDSFIDGLIAH